MSAVAVAVGATVRRLRKASRLTLQKLSARCGLSLCHLSEVERGRCNPNLLTLDALAKGLGVTLDVLFAEDGCTRVRVAVANGAKWEALDRMTGLWWSPKTMSLQEALAIDPTLPVRVKAVNAGGGS